MASISARQCIVVLFLSVFTSLCSAGCGWYINPVYAGGTCNAPPDTTTDLETIIYIIESNAGECESMYGGSTISQVAKVEYLGVDGAMTTAAALNTAVDSPQVTGTYTFSYNVPYTAIKGGSQVTQLYTWSEAGHGIGAYTFSWVQNQNPTVVYTDATSTVTTPVQAYTTSTSTITEVAVATVTPSAVVSTVVTGTRTVAAPRETITTTMTFTPHVKTVIKTSATVVTTTITCLPTATHKARHLKERQVAAVLYETPNCYPVTTTTVTTSVTIVAVGSTTTETDTAYAVTTSTSTTTLAAVTSYTDIKSTVTTTPAVLTRTKFTTVPRSTVTKTETYTVTKTVAPKGLKKCGGSTSTHPIPPTNPITCPAPTTATTGSSSKKGGLAI